MGELTTTERREFDNLEAKKRVALLTPREQQRYTQLAKLAAGHPADVTPRLTNPQRKPVK